MAESIDDLFDCFEDAGEEENAAKEENFSEQELVTERVSEVSNKQDKRKNEDEFENSTKRSKAEDVDVEDIKSYITKSEYLIPFLQPGRLLKIKNQDDEYDWGAVVNFKKVQEIVPGRKGKGQAKPATKVQVDILLHVISDSDAPDTIPKPCQEDQKGEVEIITVDSSLITHISSVRLYCPNDLRSKDSRKGIQMVQASKTIGNTDLEDKFNTAIKLIKRDIVFSSSLYL
ncbi:hypothetical protein NQ315_000541 [Exocentrus adspersus]|uniref:Exosome RNA helicase MTR4-like beta-barrel domain-containing protein n=1 Tax=Exocentrus adspersus TaxID=1586481 RepID=A0AAV8V746_9CUCU|nr:hypothetical protein NQ315_000541 [Exocentrus adspersus]